jgi:mono/diheme cytochrome c family protein
MLDMAASGAMPSAMVPDMPPRGVHRLSVELTAYNPSADPVSVDGWALVARPTPGEPVAPSSALPEPLALGARQRVVLDTWFDLPQAGGSVSLFFERGQERWRLFASQVPQHRDNPGAAAPRSAPWPKLASDLPGGDPTAGRALFEGRLACFTCHGQLNAPGTNISGPHLSGIAQAATTRVAGSSALQYLYDSLLEPTAFIAPVCAGGLPCASPSAMPAYGEVLSREEMAHLLAFLMTPSNR